MNEELLKRLRAQIDTIDAELLNLLNERAKTALAVGKAKGTTPVYDPIREGEVLQRISSLSEGPLPKGSLEDVFASIITACRELQQHERLDQ